MRRWPMILGAAALWVLAGCGSDEIRAPQLVGVRSGAESAAVTSTPTPAPQSTLDGSLLFIKGQSLYLDRLDGAPADVVVNELGTGSPLAVLPDGEGVLYTPADQRPFQLLYADLATLETRVVVESLRNNDWGIEAWLPDDRFILRSSGGRMSVISLQDGLLEDLGEYNVVVPLEGGDLLLVHMNFRVQTTPEFTDAARYNVTENAIEPIELDLEALNAYEGPNMFDALVAQGLSVEVRAQDGTPAIGAQLADGTQRRSAACDAWQIVRYSADSASQGPEVLFAASDVYQVQDVTALPDNSVVWIETIMPNCRMSTTPAQRLVRLSPDASEIELLDEAVSPGAQVGDFGGAQATLALSPDGRSLAWIAGGLDAGYSAVQVLDLETGERVELLRESRGAGGSDSVFIEEQMISAIYWLGM